MALAVFDHVAAAVKGQGFAHQHDRPGARLRSLTGIFQHDQARRGAAALPDRQERPGAQLRQLSLIQHPADQSVAVCLHHGALRQGERVDHVRRLISQGARQVHPGSQGCAALDDCFQASGIISGEEMDCNLSCPLLGGLVALEAEAAQEQPFAKGVQRSSYAQARQVIGKKSRLRRHGAGPATLPPFRLPGERLQR